MILYCIDEKHPLYGRRIRLEKSLKIPEQHIYVDIDSNVPIKLKPEQLSADPPDFIYKDKTPQIRD